MRDVDVFLERALLDSNVVTDEQLADARQYARENELDIVDALVQAEIVPGRRIALTRADMCEVPFADLSLFDVTYSNTQQIPRSIADRYCLFPLFSIDGTLTLAMDDPLNLEAADQVRQLIGCDVDPVLAEREQLRNLISRAYSLSHGSESGATSIETEAVEDDTSAPVIAAVNQLLADAVEDKASDVHLNPDEHELHLRYRVDGVLREKQGPPKSMHSSLVQRLKVMANLDLTQTRRPQDGKFRFKHNGQPVDVRMSTLPTICGENVVLRLLANRASVQDFHDLGVPTTMSSEIEDILANPYGMVLVTGPTGSGKTTTLYTAINKLNDPSRNVMTIEDPVEIRLPYVRQIQVHSEIGMTFAAALRSILRQDPDVVLVGEIRDDETARIAMQAALTGHMVLSTLHTNDAAGAVARLRDYGLPPFVINSAVLGVVAQRLVRRLCQHCIGCDTVTPLFARRFGIPEGEGNFQMGQGCAKCGQLGYSGRLGIYELMRFTPAVQEAIEQGESVDHIRQVAVEGGMRLMWRDGLDKARLGQTSLAEVAKAASVVSVEETSDTPAKEAA